MVTAMSLISYTLNLLISLFNVADCYVTVAAGAMIFLGIFYYKDDDFDKMLGKVKDETKQ